MDPHIPGQVRRFKRWIPDSSPPVVDSESQIKVTWTATPVIFSPGARRSSSSRKESRRILQARTRSSDVRLAIPPYSADRCVHGGDGAPKRWCSLRHIGASKGPASLVALDTCGNKVVGDRLS